MATKKTFDVFGEEFTVQRTTSLFKKALVAERGMEEIRKDFNDMLEDDAEYDGTAILDVELKIFESRIKFLSELLGISAKKFEDFDPKEVSDFYEAVYYWLSTREDQYEAGQQEPGKALESMKRFEK